MKTKETILAIGADLKSRFLFGKEGSLHPGPDIGDLSDVSNYERFKIETELLARDVGASPKVVVCDLHPAYFSTKFAKDGQSWFARDYKLVQIQHHHAHIASVMQEYALKGPVIGVSFDGTGYGTDGNIWGGEFLIVNREGFTRSAHFKYRMMPGGDRVVSEPWRMAVSVLGEEACSAITKVSGKDKDLVLAMMSKNINVPLTSSAGRLFDAAAALIGVCEYASHEAEGPIKLEAICEEDVEENYGYETVNNGTCDIIDVKITFKKMLEDIKKGRKKSVIAAMFHNTICEIIVKTVKKLSEQRGIKDVALSGGV
ncbi:MAG: carbamoyltransferase HypF, partial [Candidatus Omnitrophica bacterium]|nr:carbamoyltransferase HypF [Candidatus Omnitrophota bacterium]